MRKRPDNGGTYGSLFSGGELPGWYKSQVAQQEEERNQVASAPPPVERAETFWTRATACGLNYDDMVEWELPGLNKHGKKRNVTTSLANWRRRVPHTTPTLEGIPLSEGSPYARAREACTE
jgi:hypothetical protein